MTIKKIPNITKIRAMDGPRSRIASVLRVDFNTLDHRDALPSVTSSLPISNAAMSDICSC